jgi:hypothetical protein
LINGRWILEHGVEAAALLEQWLESRAAGSFASATLTNNAGVPPQIAPLSASDPRGSGARATGRPGSPAGHHSGIFAGDRAVE